MIPGQGSAGWLPTAASFRWPPTRLAAITRCVPGSQCRPPRRLPLRRFELFGGRPAGRRGGTDDVDFGTRVDPAAGPSSPPAAAWAAESNGRTHPTAQARRPGAPLSACPYRTRRRNRAVATRLRNRTGGLTQPAGEPGQHLPAPGPEEPCPHPQPGTRVSALSHHPAVECYRPRTRLSVGPPRPALDEAQPGRRPKDPVPVSGRLRRVLSLPAGHRWSRGFRATEPSAGYCRVTST